MWSVVASWMTVLGCAIAVACYYNPKILEKLIPPQQQAAVADIVARPAAKRQKSKRSQITKTEGNEEGVSTPTSSNEAIKSKKRKIVSAPVENTVTATTASGQDAQLPRDQDGDLSNKEFAQQLARAQAGTKLDSAKEQGNSKKDRRAVKAAIESAPKTNGAAGMSTETSSATGKDADDDQSQDASPASNPVSTAPTSRGGDVADMLEAPAAKPTTLRLTDVSNGATKPKSGSKAFEPVLTKKQRQRQSKQEEQRALREESDRLHEAKKQAQLRAARTAGGTSNQTKANAFQSTQNAWQSGKSAGDAAVKSPPPSNGTPLLDTLDTSDIPKSQANGAVHAEPLEHISDQPVSSSNANALRKEVGEGKASALAASGREQITRPTMQGRESWADQVNEEEQDSWATQLANEENWESVTSKKTKKKGKKDTDTSSEASTSIARPAIQPTKSTGNGVKPNGVPARPQNVNRFQSMEKIGGTDLKDAEWEA